MSKLNGFEISEFYDGNKFLEYVLRIFVPIVEYVHVVTTIICIC